MLGLSARIGTLPAARSDTHGTSSKCTVRVTVPCRAMGSILASHYQMRTVDFELILCRQVGDKSLFVIELSGFPVIHQSTVGTISDCGGEGGCQRCAREIFRGGGMITKKISKRKKIQALLTVKNRNL